MHTLGTDVANMLLASCWWQDRSASKVLRFALSVKEEVCPQPELEIARELQYPQSGSLREVREHILESGLPPLSEAIDQFGEVKEVLDPHGAGMDATYYRLSERLPLKVVRDEGYLQQLRSLADEILPKILNDTAAQGEREYYLTAVNLILSWTRGASVNEVARSC